MLNLIEQISTQVSEAQKVLLAVNAERGLDALAAGLALTLWLKSIDKQAVLMIDGAPTAYRFLPTDLISAADAPQQTIVSLRLGAANVKQIKYKLESDELNFIVLADNAAWTADDLTLKSAADDFDLIITVGTQDLHSLGQTYLKRTETFFNTPIINLDNQADNNNFGQINAVSLKAAALCEIAYSMIKQISENLNDKKVNTCLLAGLISATDNFTSSRLTPRCLSAAADLLENEADRSAIITELYQKKDLATLKLWGKILSRINIIADKLAWTTLNLDDFLDDNISLDDLPAVIKELHAELKHYPLLVLLYELSAEQTEGLASAQGNYDAIELTKAFGSTGDNKLAKINLEVGLEIAARDVVNHLEEQLKNLGQ